MGEERQFDSFDEDSVGYLEIHGKVIKMSGANSNYFSEYKIFETLKFEKGNETCIKKRREVL